jgi:DNA invertase Pin-like site-specific DNA recombinase
MSKTLAYIRASTDNQDVKNQRHEILEYAREKDIKINEFISLTMSSRKDSKHRRLDELLEKLGAGDTLIVTELSRLGRSTGEVIMLINELVAHQIRIIILKQNLDIKQNHDMTSKVMVTLFSLFGELERDLISLRTKEALAAKKAQGVQLGKPQGVIQESVYDKDRERIVDLLRMGLSVRKIITIHLKYGTSSSLSYYITTRKLREEATAISGSPKSTAR